MYEDACFYISTTPDTAKYRNLKRDSRISICVDGGREDVRTVMIYGAAQLIEGDNPLVEEMRWRIIRHYCDSEAEAREYLATTGDIDTALIVVTPHRIISQDFS